MKILNLYAGIGGNRKLWGDSHEITAIEYDENIAKIYRDYFPKDTLIVTDAHEYLREHYSEFDFIWSSPPCPSHSRMRMNHKVKIYPDMKLYEEIIFLSRFFKGKYVVENVIPYYEPLIKSDLELHRHLFWTNIKPNLFQPDIPKLETCKASKEREMLQKVFGYDLDRYTGIDKRKVLRNCVVPELGKYFLDNLTNK